MQNTRDLVDLARKHDSAAIRTLVERYESSAIVTAWNVLGDYHAAQDLAQEAFVELFRKLDHLRSGDAFGAWLLTSVRRKAIRLRSQRPAEVHGFEFSQVASGSDDRLAEFDDIVRMLDRLPEHERTVVHMRYLSGMTVRQIAEDLQRPVGTITKRLSRAIEKLREFSIKVAQ